MTDPITLAVIRGGVLAAAEDVRVQFKRAATLAILYEFNDYGISILDADYNLIADAPGIPIFLGSLDTCIERTIEELGGVDVLEDGDVLFNNHPYLTAGQPPDAVVIRPIFLDGEVLGYSALRAHMGDVGGKSPYPTDTTEIFQEGTLIPGVKLVRRGELDETIMRIVAANSRLPSETCGNILAAVSAVSTGSQRILALIERYGRSAYDDAVRRTLEDGETLVREAIAAIPDGVYSFTDYMDDNGVDDTPVCVAADLTVSGSEITVDLSRSDTMQAGPINCPWGYTLATTRFALKRVLCPDLPPSSGEYRPIRVIAPEGSLFNPMSPAPCYLGAWASLRLGDGVIRALAEALPETVPADCGGDLVQCDVWMTNPVSGRTHIYGETGGIGTGGRHGADGMNAVVHPIIAGCEIIPAELIETRMPILRRRMELQVDSGGPGAFRGGLGVVTEQQFLGDGVANVVTEKTKAISPVRGLRGGGQAPYNNSITLFEGTDRELRLGKRSPVPLVDGDRMMVRAAGGGGYGDPLDREPEAVAADVRNGYVSLSRASEDYGVVLRELSNVVDVPATKALRASRR